MWSRPKKNGDNLQLSNSLAMPKLPQIHIISESTKKINRVGSKASKGTKTLQQMVKIGENR